MIVIVIPVDFDYVIHHRLLNEWGVINLAESNLIRKQPKYIFL